MSSRPKAVFVEFRFDQVKGVDLSIDSLPAPGLMVNDETTDQSKIEIFRSLVEQVQRQGDSLLNDVFVPLHRDRRHSVQVVATSGVPQPYDAWTKTYKGSFAIFFNLSEWTETELKESGLAVVKHEVTHVLLEPLLARPDERIYSSALDYIILNEGIAHLVGYSHDRASLLSDKADKWWKAEEALANARQKLESPSVPAEEKESLFMRSNAGPFWEKYAAISGMFRAASVYQRHGAQGLIDAIRAGRLESQGSPKSGGEFKD